MKLWKFITRIFPITITTTIARISIRSFFLALISIRSSLIPRYKRISKPTVIYFSSESDPGPPRRMVDMINPRNTATPPRVGISKVWDLRESGLSNSRFAFEISMIEGMTVAVIPKANIRLERMVIQTGISILRLPISIIIIFFSLFSGLRPDFQFLLQYAIWYHKDIKSLLYQCLFSNLN